MEMLMETSTEKRLEAIEQRIGAFEYKTELRFDAIEERFDRIDERFKMMEGQMTERFKAFDERFRMMEGQMAAQFKAVDERFVLVDGRLSDLDKRLGRVEDHIASLVRGQEAMQQSVAQSLIAIASVMIAGFAAIASAIAFGI